MTRKEATYLGTGAVVYVDCDESRHALREIEWAKGILAKPDCIVANGRSMHELANEATEAAHDVLIDYARYSARPRQVQS